MAAYYNEIDPFAAQWLRNLISAGHIAPGDVDERSITEVKPDDLKRYEQCHFFAGIGVWSHALRRAGWRDSRHVWTGSCPCQPFSAAGKGEGIKDERHLWPAWFELVSECQPAVMFGEQVASSEVVGKSDGTGENVWIDIVQADLEGASYAFAPFDIPAAGFGAPHIRQRLFFVSERMGNASNARLQGYGESGEKPIQERRQGEKRHCSEAGVGSRLAHTQEEQRHRARPRDAENRQELADTGRMGNAGIESSERNAGKLQETQGEASRERRSDGHEHHRHTDASKANRLGVTNNNRCKPRSEASTSSRHGDTVIATSEQPGRTDSADSFWRDTDWLWCRDGKWRPVESGTSPLAHGAAQRVGRLRAYGNAICAEVATGFIVAYMGETTG